VDIEALQAQVEAALGQLSLQRGNDGPTPETGRSKALALTGADVVLGSSAEVDALRSALDLHAEILEQLHHEKAQDVDAMIEKLLHLCDRCCHWFPGLCMGDARVSEGSSGGVLKTGRKPRPPYTSRSRKPR